MAVDDTFTKVLLHFDGTDGSTTFTDESGKTWAGGGGGDAQIDTAQSKFGGSSLLLDGTGDYIYTADNADFDVGSGNFTIDFWIRPSAVNQNCYVMGQCDSSASAASTSVYISLGTSEEIKGGLRTTGDAWVTWTSANGVYAANTWYHVAIVRNGNLLTQYVNGTADGTGDCTGATAVNSSNQWAIGRGGEYNGAYFAGWIDEFRFSKGIARWTSNFTPPSAPYGPHITYVIWL